MPYTLSEPNALLLDVAALTPRSIVEQEVARCRVRGSKMWIKCNLEGPVPRCYKEWPEKAESRGALRPKFRLADNTCRSTETRHQKERL